MRFVTAVALIASLALLTSTTVAKRKRSNLKNYESSDNEICEKGKVGHRCAEGKPVERGEDCQNADVGKDSGDSDDSSSSSSGEDSSAAKSGKSRNCQNATAKASNEEQSSESSSSSSSSSNSSEESRSKKKHKKSKVCGEGTERPKQVTEDDNPQDAQTDAPEVAEANRIPVKIS